MKLISKEVSRAEPEYMNIHPPISVLATALHTWHLKQNKTDFTIKWSIIKKSISYTGGSKRCNLCLEEKLNILKEKDNCLLNKDGNNFGLPTQK